MQLLRPDWEDHIRSLGAFRLAELFGAARIEDLYGLRKPLEREAKRMDNAEADSVL